MRENTKAEIANDTNIKVLKAQELLVAFLYHNPDFYRYTQDAISPEDFTPGDIRAIFSCLCERINDGLSLEYTFFSELLTTDQMSYLVKICKTNQDLTSSPKTCEDCIEVIKTSKKKSESRQSVDSLSDEEYLKLFNKKQNKQ